MKYHKHTYISPEEAVTGPLGVRKGFFARQPDIYLFTACLDLSAHTQGEMCLSFLAALKFPGGLQERKTQDQGRAYIAAWCMVNAQCRFSL